MKTHYFSAQHKDAHFVALTNCPFYQNMQLQIGITLHSRGLKSLLESENRLALFVWQISGKQSVTELKKNIHRDKTWIFISWSYSIFSDTRRGLPFQNNRKDLHQSSKTDLDLWSYFGREKNKKKQFYSWNTEDWPRDYKFFFMLNSTEHEIFPARKC